MTEILRPRPRRRWATATLTVAAMFLSACASTTDAAPSGSDGLQRATVSTEALSFDAETIEGKPFDSAVLTKSPTVIWFWAPWCTVCRAEAPDVAKVAAEFAGDVEFVGIAGRGPVADMRDFVSDTGTGGFPHVADVDGSLWSSLGVASQPSFVLVDADGNAERVTGSLDEEQLRQAVKALVAG